jgi:hypothetical protein
MYVSVSKKLELTNIQQKENFAWRTNMEHGKVIRIRVENLRPTVP